MAHTLQSLIEEVRNWNPDAERAQLDALHAYKDTMPLDVLGKSTDIVRLPFNTLIEDLEWMYDFRYALFSAITCTDGQLALIFPGLTDGTLTYRHTENDGWQQGRDIALSAGSQIINGATTGYVVCNGLMFHLPLMINELNCSEELSPVVQACLTPNEVAVYADNRFYSATDAKPPIIAASGWYERGGLFRYDTDNITFADILSRLLQELDDIGYESTLTGAGLESVLLAEGINFSNPDNTINWHTWEDVPYQDFHNILTNPQRIRPLNTFIEHLIDQIADRGFDPCRDLRLSDWLEIVAGTVFEPVDWAFILRDLLCGGPTALIGLVPFLPSGARRVLPPGWQEDLLEIARRLGPRFQGRIDEILRLSDDADDAAQGARQNADDAARGADDGTRASNNTYTITGAVNDLSTLSSQEQRRTIAGTYDPDYNLLNDARFHPTRDVDQAADNLANLLGNGARSSIRIDGFGNREFDVITQNRIIQTFNSSSAIHAPHNFLNQSRRNQFRSTIEAAQSTERTVTFNFEAGLPAQEVLDKISEWSSRYEVQIEITTISVQ